VAPTEEVPVVRKAPVDGAQDLARVRSGPIPFLAPDAKMHAMMINAYPEGIAGPPAFGTAL
jgi:putative SOS response-associated peptidase YedK